MCTMKGSLPDRDDELAIDRMFAENNDIEIGDELEVGGRDYKVCGYVALSDYSTMFQNNNDTMFDATIFGVAVVTGTEFDRLPEMAGNGPMSGSTMTACPMTRRKRRNLPMIC